MNGYYNGVYPLILLMCVSGSQTLSANRLSMQSKVKTKQVSYSTEQNTAVKCSPPNFEASRDLAPFLCHLQLKLCKKYARGDHNYDYIIYIVKRIAGPELFGIHNTDASLHRRYTRKEDLSSSESVASSVCIYLHAFQVGVVVGLQCMRLLCCIIDKCVRVTMQ